MKSTVTPPAWLSPLPAHLAERCRCVNSGTPQTSGEFVLYWMCTAVRTEENPALDAACHLATSLQKPLLVYHALSETYPFASDRHHLFILQGARDVQRQMAERGLSYVFHLEQRGSRHDSLKKLADRACVVLTEDMPTAPARLFLQGLTARTTTPIVAVDTACVAPVLLQGKAYERAFQFRDATRRLYDERLHRPWPACTQIPHPASINTPDLPFAPIDLQQASLPALIADCRIDHSVGPVVDTVGGTTAGMERWQTFRQQGLKRYADRRNDPLLDGSSRMSAYLHYGMVSPLRIAREAAAAGGAGAEKYVEELLIWRELAYGFCFYRPDHEQWSALPGWARRTLEQHAADRRPQLYSWEQLARGTTSEPLWNAAQQSLLVQGELHNNVRMTWGKAFLAWTETPQLALQLLIDLNHRYALDGRDPASYGGILWCLGQFDRPFETEQSVLGTVRPRPVREHARRLDVSAYRRITATTRCQPVPSIAVIGAGLSGCCAARTLADHGLPVQLFEKSRGAGGRMSARRTEQFTIDHGAPAFTARDERFRRYVRSWEQQGLVRNWRGRFVLLDADGRETELPARRRMVAIPGMSSLCQRLVQELPVRTETRIVQLQQQGSQWRLQDEQQQWSGPFDQVVLALPGPQADALLSTAGLTTAAVVPEYQSCWTLLAASPHLSSADWVQAEFPDGLIQRISRCQTRPGYAGPGGEQLAVAASFAWSKEQRETTAEDAGHRLINSLQQIRAFRGLSDWTWKAHHWRYALPGIGDPHVISGDLLRLGSLGLQLCGDWTMADGRSSCAAESAWLSGQAAAGRILCGLQLVKRRQRGLLWDSEP
ncbi:MAG: FAD-dependent oxidoreductase [Planctomyces sp.]